MWIKFDESDAATLRALIEQWPTTAQDRDALRSLLDIARTPADPRYLKYAQEEMQRDGEYEFDDGATVSESEDGGAYVMCWAWVDASDVGIKTEDDEDD